MNDDTAKLGLAIVAVIMAGALAGILVVLLVKYGKLRPPLEPGQTISITSKVMRSLAWALGITAVLFVCSYALGLSLILLSAMDRDAVGNSQYFYWLLRSGAEFFVVLAGTFLFRELSAGDASPKSARYRLLGFVAFIVVFATCRVISQQVTMEGLAGFLSPELPDAVISKFAEAAEFPLMVFNQTLMDWTFPFHYIWWIVVSSNGNQFVIADRIPEHAALFGLIVAVAWGLGSVREMLSSRTE